MEFVIVSCDNEQRPVFVDNQEQGVTDSRLSVPEGVHVFDLGAPQNYAPAFQELLVQNTGPLNPMPVAFTLIAREVRPKRAKRKTTRKRKTTGKPRRARRSKPRKTAKKKSARKKSAKATSRKKR